MNFMPLRLDNLMRLSIYSKYQVKNKLTCNQRLQNLCCKWLTMSGHPSITKILEESLQVSRLTQNPSTVRGRKSTIDMILRCIDKSGYKTLAELETSPLTIANFIQILREDMAVNAAEMARSTVSQKYSQMCKIFDEIGAKKITITMLRNSKQRVIQEGGDIIYPQETITQTQVIEVMKILNQLQDNDDFEVKGTRTSKRKKAMLRLYLLVAACYAIRQGSILLLTKQDFNEETFTYLLAKGKRHGEPCLRSMHPVVWQAYTDYLEHTNGASDKLFTCGSWLSAGVKDIMLKANVETKNGRHGIHRFRRAWATYCYINNIPLVDAAAGLNHSDSSSTERVYQDINVKQQRASQYMVGFADHFLGVSQRLSDFEQQLEAMSPWMADIFSSGQPVFEDEAFDPVFIDNEGSLSAHCELVPAPMREDTIEIVQPLDRAGTTIKSDANEVVPAPRLELGTS